MWRGFKTSTGPLDFGLDDSTGISCGVMDYERGVVSSAFHVLVRFRWFALQLKALGIDAELMAPVHAVLKTEGKILPDHSFNGGLRGSCKVEPQKMFSSQDLRIVILPGLLLPVEGPRWGAEILAKFEIGSPVSWRLNRDQARLLVTLPKDLGGWTYQVMLEGGYTFTPHFDR